jgi:cytochrome oxidase assembly protein ShyY1
VRSFGFLLSRRWALFAVVVALLAYAAWWLGEWQFGRLEDRKADNAVIRVNETKAPTPVEDVLAPGAEVAESDEWRVVTATGTYAVEDTVIVRYRTRDGVAGVDVVVPLETASGTSLLVDRGWLRTENAGTASPEDVPDPPAGEVSVSGYVRADGEGDSTIVRDRSTRAVDSSAVGEALDREVYGGFVELRSEDPAPATALEPVELPELDNGPHFFYGLQWWFFGVLAIFGFGYLAYDERRGGHRRKRSRSGVQSAQSARVSPPSTGSITPDTKDAAGESTKAATRPNSSGRP